MSMDEEKQNSIITILIPSYNAGNFLKEAVGSVLKQTFNNWKLIIIDDASNDSSLEMITHELEDKRIEVIKNDVNIGQAKSLNIGLSKVDTPYILQLDADDWLEEDALEKMITKMDELSEDIAVLSGNIRVIKKNQDGITVLEKIRKGRFFKNKYDFLLSNTSVWPRLYRTSALRNVGGWPTDGPFEGRYIEDLRILFRLIEEYRFNWIDEVLYNHRRHETNQTKEVAPMMRTLKWLIQSTLKRWGGNYKPVFTKTKSGHIKVSRLIPLNKKVQYKNKNVNKRELTKKTPNKKFKSSKYKKKRMKRL